jgi:hypothetical protein
MKDYYLDFTDLCEYLGISKHRVKKHIMSIEEDPLPCYELTPGIRVFKKSDVDTWIYNRRIWKGTTEKDRIKQVVDEFRASA